MIGCLPTQALVFLAVFVYATHATQAIAFEWKPGFSLPNVYTELKGKRKTNYLQPDATIGDVTTSRTMNSEF